MSPEVAVEGNKSEENLGSIEPREEHLEDPAKSDQPKQQKTVFDDPDDFNVVHPLQTGWQWWIDRHEQRGKDQSDWGLNIKKLAFFDSVEGFWGTHKKVAEYLRTISAPYDCHLFKQGIRPEWEDPSNTRGGRIVLQLASHLRARANFDKLCLDTILLMIGETLKCTDSIVGCFISCRRANDKFSVWIRDIEGDTGGILCKELKTSLGESISEARLEKHGASQSGKRGR